MTQKSTVTEGLESRGANGDTAATSEVSDDAFAMGAWEDRLSQLDEILTIDIVAILVMVALIAKERSNPSDPVGLFSKAVGIVCGLWLLFIGIPVFLYALFLLLGNIRASF